MENDSSEHDKPKDIDSPAYRALENLRLRLLDLTARNGLINYKHRKKNCLRIIDELPDQLVDTLLIDDKEMRLLPVPEPTQDELIEAGYLKLDKETGEYTKIKNPPSAADWAKRRGIATEYEVPVQSEGEVPNKHSDNAIQTLWYPGELEALLKALMQTSQSAIQEMGANILYLSFGFLEWYESPDSDAARLAPLFLVPVRLNKGRLNAHTGTYEYTLNYSGEDIVANLSLREKLRIDFGMELPEIDEGTTPEAYFRDINSLIERIQPRWKLRRYLSLVLLNFSKLLMYLDLDPVRWPNHARITEHPVVSRFLAGYGAEEESEHGNASRFGEEYLIDEVDQIHDRYPLIDDADSSQHSALIDAIDGKNLVIEGPPGTGKSQTISNLIAAAASQGKKVLFVAEKLAALEVVRSRLDAVGLGDFCLELHSHKSQKRKVLDEIEGRLKKRGQYRLPVDIQVEIDRYEELKAQLKHYAELINSPWKRTGKTRHEIFAAATRYREEIGMNPDKFHPQGYDGDQFDAATQRRCEDQVRAFARVHEAAAEQLEGEASLQEHPWFGVRNTDLQIFDSREVKKYLEEWQESLTGLQLAAEEFVRAFSLEGDDAPAGVSGVQKLLGELKAISTLRGDEILDRLPELRGNLLHKSIQLYHLLKQIDEQFSKLGAAAGQDVLNDLGAVEQYIAGNQRLQNLVGQSVELGQLAEAINRLTALDQQLESFQEPLNAIVDELGTEVRSHLNTSESGLTELQTMIKLAASLEPVYWDQRDPLFDNEALDGLLPALERELDTLKQLHARLDGIFSLDQIPPRGEIETLDALLSAGGAFRWISSGWRAAKKQVLGFAANPAVKLASLQPMLKDFASYSELVRNFSGNKNYKTALGARFRGLKTDTEALEHLRQWYKRVRQEYGVGFGTRVGLGEALLSMSPSLGRAVRSLSDQGVKTQIDDLMDDFGSLKTIFSPVQALRNPTTELGGNDGAIKTLLGAVKKGLSTCGPLLNDNAMSMEALAEHIEKLSALKRSVGIWNNANLDQKLFDGRLGLQAVPGVTGTEGFKSFKHTLLLARALETNVTNVAIRQFVYANPTLDTFNRLGVHYKKLRQMRAIESKMFTAFSEKVNLVEEDWMNQSGDGFNELIRRNERAMNDAEALANWLDYVRMREQLESLGLGNIADGLEKADFEREQSVTAYSAGVYDLLSREILKEDAELARFSGQSHETIQAQFCEYDQKLKSLQCEQIAWKIDQQPVPAGVQSARVSELTELRLLQRECTKKTRHIPIRQLVRRSGNALAALKPIYMMSPMSVAQYIAPGEVEFDLVVMDEASQIKPQDALGAIARGGQLVVVGDPKQLPPTSFFDRTVNLDDDDEEITGIEESESILDATLPVFPSRRLRWHYRSQHESLIAFSNHSFYESDLVLFPSPHQDSAEFGIQYTRVKRGCFVNRKNLEEARAIAEAVREHFNHFPDDSIGVVAMSAEQRNQIESQIESFAKEDTVFQSRWEKDSTKQESLFIKNLENVQGDERDVIFISMTYGPNEPGGKVYQRFGPINSDVGWRRLNVLFTRSKKRMRIFSSMDSDDVLISPASKRGVKALRDFLKYCESGILHTTNFHTDRAPDSDFEVAVMRALQNEGFECIPQVGVAGFFIDVAVVDPGNPSRLLMGIECDGATYHSAKSARDRDRLRQAILERLGWRIRRIWSTDWFKNPQAQITPIVRELNQLKTGEASLQEDAMVIKSGAPYDVELTEDFGDQTDIIAFSDEGSLREKLERFEAFVIRRDSPDIPENKRILRAGMIEALVEMEPTTRNEFQEKIPLYLRQSIDPSQAKYLDQVFEIINACQGFDDE